MRALTYRIDLESPVIIRTFGTDPNGTKTLHYITGSAIRGAFASKYLRGLKSQNDDLAMDDEFRKLFLSSHVRFLNAYPTSEQDDWHRSLPYPFSIHQDKEKKWDVAQLDFSAPVATEILKKHKGDDVQWKKERELFVTVNLQEDQMTKVTVKTGTAKHIAVNRSKGRTDGDGGALYHYQFIQKDQAFVGVILLEDGAEVLEGALRHLAEIGDKRWRFGRAGHTGYGGSARLGFQKSSVDFTSEIEFCMDDEELDWESVMDEQLENQQITLELLSDYVPHDGGQPLLAFVTELQAQLGVIGTLSNDRTFVQTRTISGYNSTWKLPLPQRLGLAMGSVVTLRISNHNQVDEIEDKLQQIEVEGLGGRLNEGFGRVTVHIAGHGLEWQMREASVRGSKSQVYESSQRILDVTTSAGENTQATRLAIRLLEKKIYESLSQLVDQLAEDATGLQNRSVLGRMREIFRAASSRDDILQQLDRMAKKNKKPAFKQLSMIRFRGTNVQGTTAWDFLNNLLKGNHNGQWIWQMINFHEIVKSQGIVGISNLADYMINSRQPDYAFQYERYLLDRLFSRLSLASKRKEIE